MNEDKKTKKTIIVLIIIILLLLFLLIGVIYWLFNKEEVLVPNGNVDIFEINCDDNCDCSTNSSTNDETSEQSDTTTSEDTTEITTTYSQESDSLDVYDNTSSWTSVNTLRIFENPMYDNNTIIAPESSNIYQFVLKNNTAYNINYTIEFSEENDENINMMYRLMKDGKYVAGDEDTWVSYEKLIQSQIYLGSKENSTYYLEWKWFSSDNDTKVGESKTSSYKLNLEIEAYSL